MIRSNSAVVCALVDRSVQHLQSLLKVGLKSILHVAPCDRRFAQVGPPNGMRFSRGGHGSSAAVGLQALLDRVPAGVANRPVAVLWLT